MASTMIAITPNLIMPGDEPEGEEGENDRDEDGDERHLIRLVPNSHQHHPAEARFAQRARADDQEPMMSDLRAARLQHPSTPLTLRSDRPRERS